MTRKPLGRASKRLAKALGWPIQEYGLLVKETWREEFGPKWSMGVGPAKKKLLKEMRNIAKVSGKRVRRHKFFELPFSYERALVDPYAADAYVGLKWWM